MFPLNVSPVSIALARVHSRSNVPSDPEPTVAKSASSAVPGGTYPVRQFVKSIVDIVIDSSPEFVKIKVTPPLAPIVLSAADCSEQINGGPNEHTSEAYLPGLKTPK